MRAYGKAAFAKGSDDEARDEHGRWTAGAAGEAQGAFEATMAQTPQGLSEQQRADIQQYIGDDPYNNSVAINDALRKGEALTEEQERIVQSLDQAIASSPPLAQDMVTYRGVEEDYSGTGRLDRGFVSVSTDKGVARDFATATSDEGWVYRVVLPAGTRVLSTDLIQHQMAAQKEFILPRGGKLVRAGMETRRRGVTEIDMRWVPPPGYGKAAFAKDASDDLSRRTEELLASLDLGDLMDIVEALQPDLEAVAADAAAEAIATVGLADDETIVDVVNERAVLAAQDQAASLVGRHYDEDGDLVESSNEAYRIDDATRDMLRDTVAQGLEDNIGVDAIADAIEADYAFSEERADLIARTEVTNANSAGALASYREARDAGVELRKEWLLGPNPCDVCQENADAGPIDLDDEFPSGDMHPAAHPRCECAVSPVVAEDGSEEPGAEDEDKESFAKGSDDEPRDEHGRWTAGGAGTVAFADRLPAGSEVDRDTTMTLRDGTGATYDVAYHENGTATVANVRVWFEPTYERDEGGDRVEDENGDPVVAAGSPVGEEGDHPAADVLSAQDLADVHAQVAEAEIGVLEDRAEQAAEQARWDALTPGQQATELVAEQQRAASADEEHTAAVHAAVDDAVAGGWQPTLNRVGGLRTDNIPVGLQPFASPRSQDKILARLDDLGVLQRVAKGSDDEPRDERGRWTAGGGGETREATTGRQAAVINDVVGGSYANAATIREMQGRIDYRKVDLTPTEGLALEAYSGPVYRELNEALRDNSASPEQAAFKEMLNGAMSRLPSEPGVAYRGARLTPEQVGMYVPGEVIEERGFTSTSREKSGAWGGTQFEVHGRNGINLDPWTMAGGQNETLYRAGTRFRVRSNDGSTIVMEEA